MKVVIIDNHDSFTYNLHHLVNIYSSQCDVISIDKFEIDLIEDYQKIIFSPGPCLPSNYPKMNEILSKYHRSKSILGVCLGHQAIAEFYGCKLVNLEKVLHGVVSSNKIIYDDIIFNNIPDNFRIAHYHSWVIDKSSFHDDLLITSLNDSNLIMSIKHKFNDIRGLQFHPESILSEYGEVIIKNWLSSN
ncbi:MAG: aminodeoxychorismate/anthranilate synthase component II [Flavobacteriales bacterium]|nr:aminodeoxychorismate/anthranilate synthase component II [Flavobacteriales bacterium]